MKAISHILPVRPHVEVIRLQCQTPDTNLYSSANESTSKSRTQSISTEAKYLETSTALSVAHHLLRYDSLYSVPHHGSLSTIPHLPLTTLSFSHGFSLLYSYNNGRLEPAESSRRSATSLQLFTSDRHTAAISTAASTCT